MDWIEGNVTDVIDGDTFKLDVKWVGKSNQANYHSKETIRLANISKPEISTAAGRLAAVVARKKYCGKYLHCDIQARDVYGRLVCKVRECLER